MLTVIRIGLPDQLRRSLGCTNAIESLMAARAADGLPQRQTLARRPHGAAMDWNRNVGGREKLPPFEGPQATPNSEGRIACAINKRCWITNPLAEKTWQHRI